MFIINTFLHVVHHTHLPLDPYVVRAKAKYGRGSENGVSYAKKKESKRRVIFLFYTAHQNIIRIVGSRSNDSNILKR